jgi:hypothetical protein
MMVELLANNCNKSLQLTNPLWSESDPTINISSVEVLLQRCVEAL